MRGIICIFCVLIIARASGQINQIDHIYVVSPNPEKLFLFFNKDLGLPVVWNSRVKGKYASAAVWLGNVSLEFAGGNESENAKFAGIALEPQQPAKDLMFLLDQKGVAHDTVESYRFKVTDKGNSTEELKSWSIITVKNILPPETDFFICSYDYKEKYDLNRTIANDSLINLKGGPLGLVFVKELIVVENSADSARNALIRIPGIKVSGRNLFNFQKGPGLKLISYKSKSINSGSLGIYKIVIKVNSLGVTEKYLRSKNILWHSSEHSVYINPTSINGLLIQFVDK